LGLFVLVVVVVNNNDSVQSDRPTSLSGWLSQSMARNGLRISEVASKTGLSINTIKGYLKAEYDPKLSNLMALVEVIANAENRSPRQVLFEVLLCIPEMQYAEERWRRQST